MSDLIIVFQRYSVSGPQVTGVYKNTGGKELFAKIVIAKPGKEFTYGECARKYSKSQMFPESHVRLSFPHHLIMSSSLKSLLHLLQ